MSGGYVRGRKIAGESEYNLAVEDAKLIDQLTKEYDMSDRASVEKLYAGMQSGDIEFKTAVGRDFDDEVYELMQKFKKTPKIEPDNNTHKKLQNNTLKAKKENHKTANSSVKNKETVNNRTKDIKSVKNKPEYSVEQAANEILRKANRRRKAVIILASVVAIGSLSYYAFYSKSAFAAQHAYEELASLKGTEPIAEDIEQKPLFTLAEADELPDILDEYKNIYLKNKSVIGWLTIEDTNIDYPVMQTINNEYYLNHNFEGKEDNNGALFLDCNCNPIYRNTNMIIYGHHMKSGKMFGGLKKYKSEEYAKEHNIIEFDTIYEKSKYEVMYVFTADITNAEDVSFKYYQFIDAASEAEFDSNMDTMSEMSFFDTGVTATYGDELLTLSTCDGSTSTTRFVVVAKRID